jgi:L-amino acid N-acyltransferase YncA
VSSFGVARRLEELADVRRRNGTSAAAQWLGRRVVNRFSGAHIMHVIWLDVDVFRGSLQVEPGFTTRFLEPDEIRAYAADPINDLAPPDMAGRAAAGHDLCYAVLEGRRLAAYGWYALNCIEAEHNLGVAMSYPADVAYMYKGYTHVDYRGRRLHSLAMGLALKALGARGIRKLVSTVEWTNLASLKSCHRLGYVDLGRIVTVGWGRGHSFCPAAARKLQIRFGRDADLSPRRQAVARPAQLVSL